MPKYFEQETPLLQLLTNASQSILRKDANTRSQNRSNLAATLKGSDLRRKKETEGDTVKYSTPVGPEKKDNNTTKNYENTTNENTTNENTKNYKKAAGFDNLGINVNQARALAWLAWMDSLESEEQKKEVANNLGFSYDQFNQDYGDLLSNIQENQGLGDTASQISEELRDKLSSLYTDYGGDILTVDTDNYKSKNQAFNTEANYAQDYYTVGIDVTGDGVADFNLLAYETESGQLDKSLNVGNSDVEGVASKNFKDAWKEETQANNLGKYMDTGNTKYYDTSRNDLLTQQAMRNKMLDDFKDAFNESVDLNDFTTGDSEGNVSSYKGQTGSTAVNQLLLDVLNGKQGFKGLFDQGDALSESIGASGLQTFLLSGGNEKSGLEEDLTIQDVSDDGETTDYTIENSTPTELRNQISGQQMYNITRDMSKDELVKGLGATVVPKQLRGEIRDANQPSNNEGTSDELITVQTETPNAYDEVSSLVNKFLEEGSRGEFDISQKSYNNDEVQSSADLATTGVDATPTGYQNAGFYGYSNRNDDFSKDKSSSVPSVKETFGSYNSLPTSSPQDDATDHAKQAQKYVNKMMRKIQSYGDKNNNNVFSAYSFRQNDDARSPKGYNIAVPVIQDTTTDTSTEEGEE